MKSRRYKKALELINKSHYILLVTHTNPDADTISSALALSSYFYEHKIKHKVFNQQKILPNNLDFLNNFNKITTQIPRFYDLIIFVDCANKDRVGVDFGSKTTIINIDHHSSNTNFGTINLVDKQYSSTAEIVYKFFKANNINITKQIAQALYTGIYDDSLQFSGPKCNKKTFKIISKLLATKISPNKIANNLFRRDSLAKYRLLTKVLNSLELHIEGKIATIYIKPQWLKQTGASIEECDNAVDLILNISIVEVAILFRIVNNKVRVSLRSKNNVDVSIIANNFDGGGHSTSAGCNCNTNNIPKAISMILDLIKKEII